MSRYLGAAEGPKTLSGCLLARQGRTKSGSGLWGLGLKVGCGVWRWGQWFPPPRSVCLGLLTCAGPEVAAACGAIPHN